MNPSTSKYQVMTYDEVTFSKALQNNEDCKPITGHFGKNGTNDSVTDLVDKKASGAKAMWIGYASGDNGVRGRWNSKYKGLAMEKILVVYSTSSVVSAKNMEDFLITSYPNLVQNQNAGGGGADGLNFQYYVYVAWTENSSYKGPQDVLFGQAYRKGEKPYSGELSEENKDKIAARVRNLVKSQNPFYYIGITSGNAVDDESGCNDRWNNTYKKKGLNRMQIVYWSKDRKSVIALERYLIDSFTDSENSKKGGAGREPDSATYYFVYVAWFDHSVK